MREQTVRQCHRTIVTVGLLCLFSSPSNAFPVSRCQDVFNFENESHLLSPIPDKTGLESNETIRDADLVLQNLESTVSSSFATIEKQLRFLLESGDRKSLDFDVFESLKASDGVLRVAQGSQVSRLKIVFASLGIYDISREVEKLETCTLQAAVCAARIDSKMSELRAHAQSLSWSREELVRDRAKVRAVSDRLERLPLNLHERSRLDHSIQVITNRIEVLIERLDLHFHQVIDTLKVAQASLQSTQQSLDLYEKLRRAKFETSDLLARAQEPPLSLEQLSVIEKFRRTASRTMKADEWAQFIKPLRKISHWRATEQILRFVPTVLDHKGRLNERERALVETQLSDLPYDRKLDRQLLDLKVDPFVGRQIYRHLIVRPTNPEAKEIALRFPHADYYLLETFDWGESDLPLLFDVLESRLDQHQYERHSMAELNLISKIVSVQTVRLLDRLIARPIWGGYTGIGGQMVIRSEQYAWATTIREAMAELLEAEGPQILATPIPSQILEIRYGRQKKKRQYL